MPSFPQWFYLLLQVSPHPPQLIATFSILPFRQALTPFISFSVTSVLAYRDVLSGVTALLHSKLWEVDVRVGSLASELPSY